MKILLASAHPYIPQIAGGAQSSTHELAVELIQRGHTVAVLAGLTGKGRLGLSARVRLKLSRRNYVSDVGLGYAVFRAWFPWSVVAQVAEDLGVDAVVMQSGFPARLNEALEGTRFRRVIYLRNVEDNDLGGPLSATDGTRYIANSKFTAEWYRHKFGIEPTVILPLVRAENYRTVAVGANVLFINPHPLKGMDIALGVAEKCPEIPFNFLMAWTLSDEEIESLKRHAARLGNVTLSPATRDMKSAYGQARIVLAPSQWNEAFGRVAAEAHCSGIPVLGSNRGGLPEAIGPGGIILPHDAPIEDWAAALRRMWHDKAEYARLSEAALTFSKRTEMNPDNQSKMFVQVLERAL